MLRTVVVLLWRWCPAASSKLLGWVGEWNVGVARWPALPSQGCHAAEGAQRQPQMESEPSFQDPGWVQALLLYPVMLAVHNYLAVSPPTATK